MHAGCKRRIEISTRAYVSLKVQRVKSLLARISLSPYSSL